ncbi:hypothetical protein L1049_024416 [Liquidambar formosana]|uniref:Uncharacterized protein n=1 Tax=Liquidambar formosana TaxID=63359 RepID=A0AAP0RUF2_LIQFO
MEKPFEPYDKEYMKMAMLEHEETFKKQVCELHRLYEIQKILMRNMGSGGSNGWNQQKWNSKNGVTMMNQTDHHHHHDIRRKKPQITLDLERPAEDYIAESDSDGELEIEDES